jgi:hypothetical protein
MIRRKAGRLGRKLGVSEVGSQIKLADYLVDPLPVHNAASDFTSGVSDWGMLGNDQYGDCGFAGRVHLDMANSWTAKERAVGDLTLWPQTADVVSAYLAYNKGQDVGVDLGEVLAYWTQNPLGSLPAIGGFAQIDVHNGAEYQSAMALFGGLYTGIAVSKEAMTEFEAGQPWTSTATDWEGGHCVPHLARNATWGRCITWGADQLFSWDWWHAAREEAYVVLTQEIMNATGGIFNGVNVAQLKADITKLHGTL